MGRNASARAEYASKAPATRSKYQPCSVRRPAWTARLTKARSSRLRSEIRMEACSQARRRSAAVAAGICLVAVGIAANNARGSAGPLAKVVREQAKPEDTFVSLHTYPFDLALYARAPRPTWVVDDWLNPEVPTRDNWRKELYDAAKFDPATGQEVLVSPAEFNARLCKAPDGARYWVWGTTADNPVYLPLRGLSPVVTSAKYAMWRVEVDAALRQRVCGGTPKAG